MKQFIYSFRHALLIGILLGIASMTYSQPVASVSLPQTDRPEQANPSKKLLSQALSELEAKYNVSFVYENQVVDDKYVESTIHSNKLPVLLQALLQPFGLKFKKLGRNIYSIAPILPEKNSKESKERTGLSTEEADSATLTAGEGLSVRPEPESAATGEVKSFTVTGKVTDADGNSLPGVSVLLKGTTTGTATDTDGKYSLVVPSGEGVLMFSYIGYTPEEVAIGNRSEINMTLLPDIKSLSEVVVVGYGTQKKVELTGAISSVKGKEINSLPVRSVAEALQGRAAGVEVSKGDGSPGGEGTKILIRGAASINGSEPLILVDGVRVGTGFDFNMRDVERIDILKDGSSAAIYGREAAGGVILVTTKRGSKSDKVNITANAYYGIRNVTRRYDLLGTPDYITTRKVYLKDDPSFANPAGLPNTNWYKELFGPAPEKNINISASGGGSKFSYYVSGSYLREDGVRIDNWNERFGLRLNTDLQISKKFKVGQSLFLSKNNENPTYGTDIPFRSVPTVSPYDTDGSFGKNPGYFQGGNPLGGELTHIDKVSGFGLNANIFGEWEVIKGLTFKSILAMNAYSSHASNFTAPYDYGNLSNSQQTYALEIGKGEDYQLNLLLTYKKQIGKHEFSVLGGYEARKSLNGYQLKATSNNALSNPTETFNTDTTSSGYRIQGGLDNPFRFLSYFGRVTYNYADKYFLTANVRKDGAYEFPEANRFDVFPSFSAAWRISGENFLQNLAVVSNVKLRAGYGVLGNDPLSSINPFAYKSFYTRTDNAYGAVSFGNGNRSLGWGLKGLTNADLRWELVKSTNIGLDLGFFRDKLSVTLDWYNRRTDRMIYTVTPPISSGLSSKTVPINIGTMQNRGLEVAVSYGSQLGGLTYNVSANASFNNNKLLALDNLDVTEIRSGTAGDTWYGAIANSRKGQPLAQFYGYIAEGIYKTDEEVKTRGVLQDPNTGAGDLIYRDINNDKVINDKDKTFIGDPWPKMSYGLNLNLGYRGFDLTLFFQGVQGVDLYNGAKGYTQASYSDYNTTAAIFGTSFFNGKGPTDQPRVGALFTDEDDDGNPIPGFADVNGNYKNSSSFFVENGSYLKLKNLQLGYTLPKSLTDKWKAGSIRVYFQTQNLFTITQYTGLDPELGWTISGQNNDIQRGIDTFDTYPRTRLYSLGIDVNF